MNEIKLLVSNLPCGWLMPLLSLDLLSFFAILVDLNKIFYIDQK